MGNTRQLIPAARKDELVIQEVEGETLVYDLKSHKAHCLNRTAALVWKRCDGRTRVGQITEFLQSALDAPVDDTGFVRAMAVRVSLARDEITATVTRVADKLLHEPTVRIKELAGRSPDSSYADALAELFALNPAAVEAVSRAGERR